MIKETSAAVKKSMQRRGVTPTSFAFSEDEKNIIDDLQKKIGGSKKEALMTAARSYLSGKRMTNAELVAELSRRLK